MPAPLEGTNVQASATGGNTNNTATLSGTAGTLLWLTKMIITVGGATAALAVNVTTGGLSGGNLTIPVESQAGAGALPQTLDIDFPQPIKASNPNVDITANLPALGVGNTTAGITICGIRTPAP